MLTDMTFIVDQFSISIPWAVLCSLLTRSSHHKSITSDLQKFLQLMAPVWSDVRAALPSTVCEFPLHFREKIELSVLKVLELARDQLYSEADCPASAQRAQVITDYSWEKLNTGTWRGGEFTLMAAYSKS